MKIIGIITPGFPRYKEDYSGIFIKKLADQFAKENHATCVFTPADIDDDKNIDHNLPYQVIRVPYAPKFLQYLFYRPSGGFPQLIKTRKPIILLLPLALLNLSILIFFKSKKCNVLHCHWIPTLLLCLLPKIFYRKPLFVTIRGSDLKLARSNKLIHFISSFLLRFTTKVIAVSKSVEEEAVLQFKHIKGKTHTIENGISTTKTKKNQNNNQINLLFVGNLVPEKGIIELMEAFDILIETQKNIQLTLIGDDQTEITDKVSIWKEKHKDKLLVTGMLDNGLVLEHMNQSDIFILPSYSEGRPNAMLEAMGSQLCVIATDLVCIKEIITNNDNGILIPVKNSFAILKALQTLINDNDLRDRLAHNAKEYILKNNLTWENSAKKHLNLYFGKKQCAE